MVAGQKIFLFRSISFKIDIISVVTEPSLKIYDAYNIRPKYSRCSNIVAPAPAFLIIIGGVMGITFLV